MTAITLKRDLHEFEMKLELELTKTKVELVCWIVGVGLFQTAIITALLLKLSARI